MQVADIVVVNVDILGPVVDILIAYQYQRCLVVPLNLYRRGRLVYFVFDNTHPFKVVANKLRKSEVSKQLRNPEAFLRADRQYYILGFSR